MKIIFKLFMLATVIISCSENNNIPQNSEVTLKFTHHWDGTPVTSSDFNNFKFTNKNGEKVSIVRLRYLLSKITIGNTITDYHLINIGENSGLELKIEDVPLGTQTLKFTFGFTDTDNVDGKYQDLNSVSFDVPAMLGGGYHFMQFDGKYKNTNGQDANFNYHAIRAVDRTDAENIKFEDTSFLVDVETVTVSNTTTIEIKMNIAEWFKNPNTWNLNELNTVLMPNFKAQKLMNANGKTVFSLGEINQ